MNNIDRFCKQKCIIQNLIILIYVACQTSAEPLDVAGTYLAGWDKGYHIFDCQGYLASEEN